MDQSSLERRVYYVAEIALILGISKGAVYKMCRNNPPFMVLKFGRRTCILKDSFDSWLFSLNKKGECYGFNSDEE